MLGNIILPHRVLSECNINHNLALYSHGLQFYIYRESCVLLLLQVCLSHSMLLHVHEEYSEVNRFATAVKWKLTF